MTKYERLQQMSIEEVAWELIELASVARVVAMGVDKDSAIKAVKSLKGTTAAEVLVKQGVEALMKEEGEEQEVSEDAGSKTV